MADEYAFVGKSVTDLSTVLQEDGGAVAAGDFVIFGEGNQTITNGLTTWNALSAGGGNDGLKLIWVKRNFTGNIGSEGGSLDADVAYGATAEVKYDAGGGKFFYRPVGTANTCDRFRNIGFGQAFFTGNTITNYEQGPFAWGYFNASAVVLNLHLEGGTTTILNNATDITTLFINGATVNCQRDIDDMWMGSGSTFNVYREDSSSTKPTIDGTAYIMGGRFNWKGGNIKRLEAYGDTILDFTGVTKPITIGSGGAPDGTYISKRVLEASKGKLNPAYVTLNIQKVYGADADSAAA